jgi:16S rRNA G966 N2-methylase RsmD
MRIIAGKYRSRLLKSLKGDALRPTSDRLRETLFNILGADVAASRFLDVFAGTGAVGIEALSRGAAEAIFIERHAPAAKLIRSNLESLGIARGATILASDALAALEKLAARSANRAPRNSRDVIPSEARNPLFAGDSETKADPPHEKRAEAQRSPGQHRSRNDKFVAARRFVAPWQPSAHSANLSGPLSFIGFVFVDPPYAAHDDYTRTLTFLGSDAAAFLAPDALVIFEHHHKFALPETAGRLTRSRILKQGDAALSFYRRGQ